MKQYIRLVKFPLSVTVAAAFLAGYLVQTPRIDVVSSTLFFSVLLLACGCGCLNNYQDRFLDKRFSRTRDRPLPANKIPSRLAMVLVMVLIPSGLYGLYCQSLTLFFLGLLAVCFYNFLYTSLKRRTLWAMLPGVACGMLPPWMGWLAAGGEPLSLKIWLIMVIFGVWQMPHFWLLLLANNTDFAESGIPNMLTHFLGTQLKRILLVWVVGFAALTLCLPLVQLVRTDGAFLALSINAAGLILVFCILLFSQKRLRVYRALFIHLNLGVFISMTILVIDSTLSFQG